MIVPSKAFFTKGVGFHKNALQSYELALRDARIETQNLVSVSSIFPPNCEIKDYDERREIYLMSGKVVEALSFPCVARGRKGGYVTAISCVVFIT